MKQDVQPQPVDTLYTIYDRSLNRITNDDSSMMAMINSNSGSSSPSTIVEINPGIIGPGDTTTQTNQAAGFIASGKPNFQDFATPGYIIGIDKNDGVAKLLVGTTSSYLFWNGTTLTIQGNITATTGAIGGWSIGATALTAGTGSTTVGLDSGGTNPAIYAGNTVPTNAPFQVFNNGYLIAANATINGTITATAGSIGGFTITGTTLYGGIIQTSATVGPGSTGVILDSSGLRGYDSVLGNTFNLPTNGSAPTFSSGIINSSTFNVNTNAVIQTSSTVGDGTANSAGILINNTGIYGCGPNQTTLTANFQILNNGGGSVTLGTTGYLRGGQTDFNTGNGFFLGYSTSNYKFSVGTATNYLTWDGTYLRLKGSFDVGTNGVINNSVYTVANLPMPAVIVGYNYPSAYE